MVESRCGILCSECKYREEMNCGGCINIEKPFWSNLCPVKNCCEAKELKHCGECTDFPCELLNQFAYDKKQGDNGKRIEQCKKWLEKMNHTKILSKKAFEEIRLWIYRNARPIDLAVWQYEFENGSKEKVVSALWFYQNEDGGFGNALEPDNWNPGSSPATTLTAINRLKSINFKDLSHPIVNGIMKYLKSGVDKNEEGWLFAIPSNNNHPHATWWTVDEDNAKRWPYANSNVTAGICCFILEYYKKESELYKEAVGYINNKISMINENKLFDEFTVGAYKNLLENIKKLGLEKEFDTDFLTQALEKMGKSEDIIGNNPDKIIEDRQEKGVWDIPWTWKEYPEEFAVAKNWWKADLAIGRVKLLKKLGRIG